MLPDIFMHCLLVTIVKDSGFSGVGVFSAKTIKVLGSVGHLVSFNHLNWIFSTLSPGSG